MSVSKELIRAGYQLLLGREPESDAYLDLANRFNSEEDVRRHFLLSQEYSRKNIVTTIQQLGIRPQTTLYFKSRYGFLMPISLAEPLTLFSYANDDYEQEESAYIFDNIDIGDYCVDLGARHGWFSGIMAARVGGTGKVFSFEPMPPICGVRELIDVNRFSNIEIIAKGASNDHATIAFDMRSLSANTHAEGPKRSIEVTRLDDELKGREKLIKLIKADIEGAEYLALQGAQDILTKDRPLIVMELNDAQQRAVSNRTVNELLELLREFGYHPYGFGGHPLQDDEIAVRVASGEILNVIFLGH